MSKHYRRAKKKKKDEKKRTAFSPVSARQNEILKNWEAAFGLAPKLTAIIEDCALTLVYDRLGRGEYDAYKDGNRTKITVESIKRRRASLPNYKPLSLPLHGRAAEAVQA